MVHQSEIRLLKRGGAGIDNGLTKVVCDSAFSHCCYGASWVMELAFGGEVFIEDVVGLIACTTVQAIDPFEKKTGKPGGVSVKISTQRDRYVVVGVCRE